MLAKLYDGRPCIQCAATQRYVSNGSCILCERNRARLAHRLAPDLTQFNHAKRLDRLGTAGMREYWRNARRRMNERRENPMRASI